MAEPAIEQRGAGVAAVHLARMGKRARDVRDASYKVRTVFRKAEESRFRSNGAGTWQGLADSTRQRKAAMGQDPRILRATGALYKSLTAPRASNQVDERKPDALRFGTSVPYAAFHDTGRGVPRRQLIDLTGAERRAIEDEIAKYVASETKGDRW
jgi:phage gpG-like protein